VPASDVELSPIIEALRSVSPDEAIEFETSRTRVRRVPAPFLRHYGIYRLEYTGRHLAVLHVAYAPERPLYRLTGEPDEFIAAAGADGVQITTAEAAVQYVEVFLEVTRDLTDLLYMVGDVEQLRLRPSLDEAARQQALERYKPSIQPPHAEKQVAGFQVILTVVRQQTLERRTYEVSTNGAIAQSSTEVIASDLPTVLGA
jgi:hypothetical protein